jgi:hypothetical protein
MDKVTAPEAESKEVKVLKADTKEVAVLTDGKRENTLNELREAGHISPNDRRIALAAKGGPDGKDIVNLPVVPITKDTEKEAEVVDAVKKEDAEAESEKEPVVKKRVATK